MSVDLVPKFRVGRPRSLLRPYQQAEILRLADGQSRGLFWQAGAGKTATVLHAVADAFATGRARRVLLVSTPTIIRSTWPEELEEWRDTAHLDYLPLVGPVDRRSKVLEGALKMPGPFIAAIGFDSMHSIVDCAGAFDVLVVDEASMARNPKSRRFNSLIKFAAKARQRIILTGSPAPNSIVDLFGVVALIDLGASLGRNYNQFLADMTTQWGKKAWQRREKPGVRPSIMEKIKGICTSVKTQHVASIPAMTRRVVSVTLPQHAQRVYETMESAALNALTKEPVHRDALITKCQQICNGFLYGDNGSVERIHSEKIEATGDIVDEVLGNGGSVMLVYHYTADLAALRERFRRVEVLGGPEATGAPDTIIRRWSAGEIDILALNPRAAGHGINLQLNLRCSTQIWIAGTWSAELYEQTVARIWRPGLQNKLTVYVLTAAETLDDIILRVMDNKLTGQAAVMSALKARAAERASPDRGEAIRAARRAAAAAHPDAGGTAEAFREAWAAYQQLVGRASA